MDLWIIAWVDFDVDGLFWPELMKFGVATVNGLLKRENPPPATKLNSIRPVTKDTYLP